jgi:hypothetical protein
MQFHRIPVELWMKRLGMPAKITSPILLNDMGSAGLNTQAQDSTLGPQFLTEADGIVFDLQGRMSSRKGIKQVSKAIASSVKSIGGYIKSNRTREYYAGAGSAIYKIDTSTTPYTLTAQSFAGSPQTISDGNWQWINFNDELWGIQSGHQVINYTGSAWSDITDLGTYVGPSGVTTFDPSCALGDFGRMWYGGITEAPGVVYYSDNLIGEKLNTGAAGAIDLKTVWGNDEVVGLASLMNKLIIFGKQNIAVYEGADTPSTMGLDELIKGTGLAGRDNISYVSTDIIFLSYEGLMSLGRLAQTDGKAPYQELSVPVRNDLTRILSSATIANIKSTYYSEEGLVIIFMPDEKKCYVFDLKLTKAPPKVTTWAFTTAPLCGLGTIDGKLFMGTTTGIAEYSGYQDVVITNTTATNGSSGACSTAGGTWDGSICWSSTASNYSYTFQTSWLDLNSPTISKIIKSGLFTITGGRGAASTVSVYKDFSIGSPYSKTFNLAQEGAISLWGDVTTLYGAAKYGASEGPNEYKVALGRTGKVIKLKMVTQVNGNYSSLNNTILLTKQGKIR